MLCHCRYLDTTLSPTVQLEVLQVPFVADGTVTGLRDKGLFPVKRKALSVSQCQRRFCVQRHEHRGRTACRMKRSTHLAACLPTNAANTARTASYQQNQPCTCHCRTRRRATYVLLVHTNQDAEHLEHVDHRREHSVQYRHPENQPSTCRCLKRRRARPQTGSITVLLFHTSRDAEHLDLTARRNTARGGKPAIPTWYMPCRKRRWARPPCSITVLLVRTGHDDEHLGPSDNRREHSARRKIPGKYVKMYQSHRRLKQELHPLSSQAKRTTRKHIQSQKNSKLYVSGNT